MAQVVPAEVGDPGSLEDFFPRRSKSGGDIKDTRSNSGLFAPVPQHVQGFLTLRGTCRVWRFFALRPSTVRSRRLKSTELQRNFRASPRRSPVFIDSSTAGVRCQSA